MNPQQPLSPPPTTPKKEVHLLGPRPAPLELSKDSVKIKKPPAHPHLFRHNAPPQQQQQQLVVIHTVSPKVIHTSANEFMSLVPLTGPSYSPPGDFSPAARLASIEKTSRSSNNTHHFPATNSNTSTLGHGLSTSTTNDDAFMDSIMDSVMELGVDLMGQFPSSILSPSPATMQPIPAGFFSPAAEDPQNGFSWQGLATGNNHSWQELGTRSSAQMADLAVREALAAAEKVLIALYQRFERPTKLHDDVEIAQNCLKMMYACVRNSVDPNHEDTALSIHTCHSKFLNIAYRIEDVLDEFMIQLVQTNEDFDNISQQTDDEIVANFIERWAASFNLSRHINDIVEKNIIFVKSHLNKSCNVDDYRILQRRSRSRLEDSSSTVSYQHLEAGDDVVGFEEHQRRLVKELIKEDSNFSTILIAGPGGSGKSTLAKNIFENKDIRGEFHCHIWVTVTRRPFQLDELLKEMLTDLGEKPELVQERTDLKAKLRLSLQHKRSLVVLDDVWRKQDLRNILKALPNGARGSKVMITSRNSDVVSFLSSKYIHDLSPGLDSDKGKELLWKKALPHDSRGKCPRELEWYSSEIVKWCGGLPQAISEIGTLLATKPATVAEWKDFLENLGSEIKPGSSLSIISRILQPSFMDLPIHLKTCFLYLRVFPADYEIQPERLIHMWVAEGFVEPRSGLTMEQVAEGYLDELIGKSLMVSVEREDEYDGRVQTYLVVSQLVRDFIFSKEENFITVFEPPPRRTCTEVKDIRRLSVHGVDNINVLELINIRTLVFCGCRPAPGLRTNKFLRVLDLELVDYREELPEHFGLRYLKLTGCGITEVPKSISNLRLLETLNLEGTGVFGLPEEICQLHNLRHLLFDKWASVVISPGIIEALCSIQTLRGIEVTNTEIVKALRKLKGLSELGITLRRELGKELCSSLEKMEHLSTLIVSSYFLDLDHMQGGQGRSSPPVYLQHLQLNGRLLGLPKWISQLTSLQKLCLRNSQLNANPLEVLQALPHLIELNMFNSYQGEELLFKAKTFKKLMKLYVTEFLCLNLVEVEVGALPLLKELHISRCPYLKSPPEGIGGLNSLCKLFLDPHLGYLANS